MNKILLTCLFHLFYLNLFGQLYMFEKYNNEISSKSDSLFYSLGVEDTGGAINASNLAKKLPIEYLLHKLKSADVDIVTKSLTILCYAKSEDTVDDIALLLSSQKERLVIGAVTALTKIGSSIIVPYLNQALIDGLNRYENKETFFFILNALKGTPDESTISVLNTFISEVKNRFPDDEFLIQKASNVKYLLIGYFGDEETKKAILEEAVNNIKYLSWGLNMIKKENDFEYVEILRRSKYSESFEVQIVRRLLGDTTLTENEIKRLDAIEQQLNSNKY